jgi:3-hydroxyisobutyrate dehydrogenase-like beta-hydroxyacid dehydrogenase
MDVGFIGLGNIGFPMAHRLVDAGHAVTAFDTRGEVVDELVALGARAASSPRHLADQVETVMTSLPSLQASLHVAVGEQGLIHGQRIRRLVDLSTTGSVMLRHISSALAERGIATVDSPVSGGVGGAKGGTLAVMVSGPPDHVDAVRPLLEHLGRPIVLGDEPGQAQTMKLVNNMLSATALAATAEALALGVKAGLDAATMIEVINAGSGATSASRDKFPRAVLTRTFDYGFATGLMVKDLRLCAEEARALDLSFLVSNSVLAQWETTLGTQGPESDFTSVVLSIEEAAGVTIGTPERPDR